MAERSIASDCKSDASGLRRFESCSQHQKKYPLGIFLFARVAGRMRNLYISGIGSEEKIKTEQTAARFLFSPS